MSERSKNIEYLVGVDHLRAYAALLVVFYHGSQLIKNDDITRLHLAPEAWSRAGDLLSALVIEGHTAVGLFMVLSGFIFSYGAAHADVDYFAFIRNRFWRTYPLFLVLLCVGMCTWSGNVSLDRVALIVFGLASFNNAPSVFFPFSGMFWAISVEWQFYVAFPLLLRVVRPNPLKQIAMLLVLCMAARWLSFASGANPREMSYWTILGRIDQFLLGMLVGLYLRKLPKLLTQLLLLPVLAGVLASLWQFNRWGGWPLVSQLKLIWPLWEGLMWAAFVACYLSVAEYVPRLLSRLLCWIGEMSYSIYLWHFVILHAFIVQHLFRPFSAQPYKDGVINTALILLPATLLLSWFSYQLLEKPFFKLRVRYLRPLSND